MYLLYRKVELAVLAHDLALRLLAAPASAAPSSVRTAALAELASWLDSPSTAPEIFINFDMDRQFVHQVCDNHARQPESLF